MVEYSLAENLDSIDVIEIPNEKSIPESNSNREIARNYGNSFISVDSRSYGTFGSLSSGSLAMFGQYSSSSDALLAAGFPEEAYNDLEHSYYIYSGDHRQSFSQRYDIVDSGGMEWDDDAGSFCEAGDDIGTFSTGDPSLTDGTQSRTYMTSDTDFSTEVRQNRLKALSQKKKFFPGKASTLLILWNVVNMMTNLSILAIPFAVSSGGIVTLAVIPLLGLITFYTGNVVIKCTYKKTLHRGRFERSIRTRADYSELAQDSTDSKIGGLIVSLLEVVEMVSTCCLNVSVLGALINEILPTLDVRVCTVIGGVAALPTFFVRKLSVIGWMQTVSIVSLGLGVILIEGFCIGNFFKWSLKALPLYNLKNLPVAVGIILFAFGIHPVLPGIEQQMKKPKVFNSMLFFAKFTVTLAFISFGFTNAILYGKKTDQVITVDLGDHFGVGISAAIFIFISIMCMFALPSFVAMDRIDRTLSGMFPTLTREGSKKSYCISFLVRFSVVLFCVVAAVFLPCFGLLMAFFGSTVCSVTCLILPCWFHLKIKGHTLPPMIYCLDIFIIVLASFFFISGGYFSCAAMVRYFNTSIKHQF